MFNTRLLISTLTAWCGLMLLSAQPARCADLVLEPCADTFIMSVPEGAKQNFGSDPFFVAYNDSRERMNVLMQFKTGELKSRSIRSAHLRLWCGGWEGDFFNNSTTTIYALSTPWKENEATWYAASKGNDWKQPGGDLVQSGLQDLVFAKNTRGVSITSGAASMMEWDVTDLVRLWANGTLRNYGLRLDAGDNIFLFESRESPFAQMHPQLIVTFGK